VGSSVKCWLRRSVLASAWRYAAGPGFAQAGLLRAGAGVGERGASRGGDDMVHHHVHARSMALQQYLVLAGGRVHGAVRRR
jgi:hypothetical protein